MSRNRGQLVVLAALALAIALVPMALAYLQLGYHDDVRAATVDDDRLQSVERTLGRTLTDLSADVPARHPWHNRSGAVSELRSRLQPTIHALRTASVDSETATTVSYNHSRAQAWERANCPRGPAREFGQCRVDRGVVVQERDGRTHVLAVAVDISVTTPDGEREMAAVVTATPRR